MPKPVNEAAVVCMKEGLGILAGRFVRRLSCRLSVPETSLRLWQGIKLPHLTQQRTALYADSHRGSAGLVGLHNRARWLQDP